MWCCGGRNVGFLNQTEIKGTLQILQERCKFYKQLLGVPRSWVTKFQHFVTVMACAVTIVGHLQHVAVLSVHVITVVCVVVLIAHGARRANKTQRWGFLGKIRFARFVNSKQNGPVEL